MKPNGKLKLVSQLMDLPLVDSEGAYCGIVDDIEMAGRPGRPLALKAILAGPGAYRSRLPNWALAVIRAVAGDRVTKVPIARVRSIGATVRLDAPAADLGLGVVERRAASFIPRWGAL